MLDMNTQPRFICEECGHDHGRIVNPGMYKYAASGSGLIVTRVHRPDLFEVLLTMRTAEVGQGLGITGGGYVDVGTIAALPDYTMVETASEMYREAAREENLGFNELISEEEMLERAQCIGQFHVSTPVTEHDMSQVHGTNFYCLNTRDDEWEAIAALEGNSEREGDLIPTEVKIVNTLSRLQPEDGVIVSNHFGALQPVDFYHRHELHAIGMIAWHLQNNKLWQPT